MNQIRKLGSGGVIARCTWGSQLISGGPGFERKCSCDTEPFLPSLSCPWPGSGGHGCEVEQGRGRRQRARPQPLPGMCIPTCAHSHLGMCTHTQGASWSLAHLLHHQTLHSSFHCIHMPTPYPGHIALAWTASQALSWMHCNAFCFQQRVGLLNSHTMATLLNKPPTAFRVSCPVPAIITVAFRSLCPAPVPAPHLPSPPTALRLPLLLTPWSHYPSLVL